MKKLIIFASFILLTLFASAQYRNLVVNQKIHFQDDSLNSCYVVIQNVSIIDVAKREARFSVMVYKSLNAYNKSKKWVVDADEIPQFITITISNNFNGDALIKRMSVELKQYLLQINPSWEGSNINIE